MNTPQSIPSLPVHPVPDGLPEPSAWRLVVGGCVAQPLSLTAEDITSLTPAQRIDDFACLEGWKVEDLRWEGVPVQTVLSLASPAAGARWLRVAAGGFSITLPLEEAQATGLLAYRLDDAPLTRAHGGPLRLIAPARECYYGVKWVDHLEVLIEDQPTTGEAIARARLTRPR